MAFYYVQQFPALMALQNNWQIIADECNALDKENIIDVGNIGCTREDVAAYLMANNPIWVRGWDGFDKWLNWGIALNYQFPLGNAGIPKTVNLLKRVAGLKFASLSLLRAGGILPLHDHKENEGLLTFHLGLDVPKYCCAISVNDEMHYEAIGHAIVFDGSKPHFSFNASDKDRLILYCEFIPSGGGTKN